MSVNRLPGMCEKLGVAITVRNSAEFSKGLIEQLVELHQILRRHHIDVYAVITDDCSADFTYEALLASLSPHENLDVFVSKNSKRLGATMNRYQALTKLPSGLTYFSVLDGDTEEPIKTIADLLFKLRASPNAGGVVATYRYSNHSFLRRASSITGWYVLHVVSGGRIIPFQSALRLYRAEFLDQFRNGLFLEGSMAVSDALLPRQSIAYPINKSSNENSNFGRLGRVRHFWELLVGSRFLLVKLLAGAMSLSALSLFGLFLAALLPIPTPIFLLPGLISLSVLFSLGSIGIIALLLNQRRVSSTIKPAGPEQMIGGNSE